MSSKNIKEYKEYIANEYNFLEVLETFGICVIPNIFSDEECKNWRNNLGSDLKYIHQDRFNIEDEKTWKNFYDMFPAHSFLIQHFGIAHLQSVWEIRQDERLAKIFSKIYNVKIEDLRTSYDGISVGLPPEKTNRGWYKNSWLHCDQGIKKQGRICVQGQVNLYPVNEGDASLVVLEGSHKYHNEFFKKDSVMFKYRPDKKDNEDWHMLEPDDVKLYLEKGCKEYLVKAPVGSLILWDSRTIHSGHEVQRGRKSSNFRMVVYVCHLPFKFFDKKAVKRREKAFEEKRVLNHWSAKMFSKDPRTYGNELKTFNKPKTPILSDLGKILKQ